MADSWVPVPDGSGFGLDNLPYGVVASPGRPPRPAVRVGDHALDLDALATAGLLPDVPDGTFAATTLNGFLGLGREVWSATRTRVRELLAGDAGDAAGALVSLDEADVLLPIAPGDYVDFYSSLEHASNLGRMFRPDVEPLLPNWRHLPVGYHGRSSSIVVSGTPVRRPQGQLPPGAGETAPAFGPTQRLDIELELGFVTGGASTLGEPIPIEAAADHVFGFVLVNDWSARDIQRWEYQPLGPFLGKSFATSVSPWIVPLEALEPFRVAGPAQEPEPFAYLRTTEAWALDLDLEVALVPDGAGDETVISSVNARGLYWNAAQQLAHATVNGANVRPGDLWASGTISGSEPGSAGSLIEITWNGRDPLELPGGVKRTFLEDGDTVVMRGRAGGGERPLVSLGEVRGTIAPAVEDRPS
jgi:fumarylacetoacetase